MKTKFVPGWKMTWGQRSAYFKTLEAIYAKLGITTAADKESMRKLIHTRAFGSPISAKEIDHMRGFDAFKAECLAWLQPDNMNAQLRMEQMPLIRLRYRIRELADEPYINVILRDRFNNSALDDLNEAELEQLRNTLDARAGLKKKRQAVAAGDPDWTV